jgi:polyvinyl alcohol dehydrogenase (cytochrome)
LFAPSRLALSDYNPNAIFHALNNGIMRTQAAALSEDQRIAVAEYLTGATYNRDRLEKFTACSNSIAELDLSLSSNWNGWGNNVNSQRFQSAAGTRISGDNLADLEVAWAIGVEGASASRSQPAIVDGVMVYGSPSGQVYALDLESGCHYWTYAAISEVRAAPTVVHSAELDKDLVIIADQSNRVYALDMTSGEKIWHADPDANPWAVSSGARQSSLCAGFIDGSGWGGQSSAHLLHLSWQCRGARSEYWREGLAYFYYGRGQRSRQKQRRKPHFSAFRGPYLGFGHLRY